MTKNVLALSVASALSFAFAQQAQGSAFALAEQGVSGLGNAYAGAAAAAEDASTVWWNPAGMSRLPQGAHVLLGVHGIVPSTKFTNGGSVPAAASNPTATGQGGDAGESAVVPNLFFALNLKSWSIGLGISVPFGLKTAYDANWIGRFQGVESEVMTLNVNPSVAFKISDRASVGLGVSYQHAEINLLSAVNYSGIAFGAGGAALLAAVGGPGVEGQNRVKVEGDAWGWNLGGLFDLTATTRVGAHYRSSIHYKSEGNTGFTNVPAAFAASPALAAATSDGDVRLDFETPSSVSFSAVQRLGGSFELLADATWTEWSKITSLPLVRSSGAGTGQTLDTLTFNFSDTWRFAIGANYKSGAWTLRTGFAYDHSPVRNAQDRTVRLPDEDRYWLSVGATWRPSASSRFDVGYTFVQFEDADINNDQSARARGIVRGNYEGMVNILSIQYQHSF